MSDGAVVVLGATGYLGSKVVRRLAGEGRRVICARRASSDTSWLADLAGSIAWIPASPDAVEAACALSAADVLVSLVCDYGRGGSLAEVADANLGFPLGCMEAAACAGVGRVVSVGTPLPRGLSAYAATKAALADLGGMLSRDRGVAFVNVLPEMFYGADEPEGRFLSSVARRMVAGDVVETTLGTQRRDIVRAEDVADAVAAIVWSDARGCLDVPVGTGVAPTVAEVVDFIWELTGRRSELCRGAIPMREGEPDSVADLTVLREFCAWEPMPWREGIEEMVTSIMLETRGGALVASA